MWCAHFMNIDFGGKNMFNSNDGFTMPVMPACGSGYGNGFGGEGSWIIWLVVILAIFGGWGNGNWGGYCGGQSTSVYEGYVLNNDFSQLSKQISDTYNMTDRKFEGIANGICSLGYDQQAQMNNLGINIMQGTNTLQAAVKDCCCQTQQNIADVKYTIGSTGADISRGVERGFADTNYNLATQANMLDRTVSDKFCQTNFNNATNTRDIIDATNAGFQRLDAKIDAIVNSQKDAKIAEQACIINNQVLLSEINKKAIPAYVVPNPNCCCGYGQAYGTTIA